jgi:hypothetical protein
VILVKVKFYGGSKDGAERDMDPEQGYNITVVAAIYHPYCPQVDQETYEMKEDGNLYVIPSEIKPCKECSVIKDDIVAQREKLQIEIAFHKAICNCDFCGIEDGL